MRNEMLAAALLALAPLPAFAHVTLVEPTALPGADYVAHFRVGHGCDGSPTIALTVGMPADVSNVRPQAQAGWTIATVRSGARTSAVTWKGGRIAADKPGEFQVAMKLPANSGMLAFPATQTCEKGTEDWSELPAADGHKLKNPAPLLTVSATAGSSPAAPAQPSALSLNDGWIRLLPGNLPAAGYFTLRNNGKARVALTGADTPACGMLMLHKSQDTGGMSSMQDVEKVDVPGGGSVSFSPGGYHLMCMDPRPALKLGASVPVTLSFQGAPPLTARFDVRGATGK
jgi:copper(I)-binding protein